MGRVARHACHATRLEMLPVAAHLDSAAVGQAYADLKAIVKMQPGTGHGADAPRIAGQDAQGIIAGQLIAAKFHDG